MRRLPVICIALAWGAAVMTFEPAVAQSKMTKEKVAAACRQEVGRGSMPGSQQREIQMCIKAKMGAGKKKN